MSSDHKLTLTGTPIENSLIDLWAQFNFINPDMTEEQEKIYTTEKNSIRNEMLKNKELFLKNNIIALRSLLHLRFLSP